MTHEGRRWRLAVLAAGVRWATNIVVEVLSNHGGVLGEGEARAELQEATRALERAAFAIRKIELEAEYHE